MALVAEYQVQSQAPGLDGDQAFQLQYLPQFQLLGRSIVRRRLARQNAGSIVSSTAHLLSGLGLDLRDVLV